MLQLVRYNLSFPVNMHYTYMFICYSVEVTPESETPRVCVHVGE